MTENKDITDTRRIYPVFSYPCVGGGDIYIYFVETEVAKFVIATFDNIDNEYAFAIQTITSNSQYEAVELIRKAEKEFDYFGEDNPFTQLYEDHEAMAKLSRLMGEFFNGD
jgi:hypothetical protein